MTDSSLPAATAPSHPDRLPQRVRHTLRLRRLAVRSAERLAPHLVRITLEGDELEGFASPGFDDHVKLFIPDEASGELHLPTAGPDGLVWGEGPRPTTRDYTPRRFDPAAGTLEIDFALHEAGPATRWAEQARPGQALGVGGPRGSFLVPTGFDWHLLVGDDTALPAIARRLAELPAGARAVVVVEVDGPADRLPLDTEATLTTHWVHREDTAPGATAAEPPLLTALRGVPLLSGDYHAWVACESSVAKAVRAHLLAERGAHPKWIRASGYWRRGRVATHDSLDE